MFHIIVLISQIVCVHLKGDLTLRTSTLDKSREEDRLTGFNAGVNIEKQQAYYEMVMQKMQHLELLKHYRLKHLHTGQGRSLPCLYSECPCSFKGWGALHTHLSKDHTQTDHTQVRANCFIFMYGM